MKRTPAFEAFLRVLIGLLVVFFQVAIAGCALLCLEAASDHLADCVVLSGDLLCVDHMSSSLVFALSPALSAGEAQSERNSPGNGERIRPPGPFRAPPLKPPEFLG